MPWNQLLNIGKYYILPVLDILLVAFILYKTYMILYGTRAILVLKGLIIFSLVYFTSVVLHLQTLNLLMKYLVTYGVIAFIVVFQPEIRRALMRVGEQKLFLSYTTKKDIPYLSEIIDAVKFFSKKKTGALIVIKKKAGLRNIENTGVPVDAHITSELIISIFSKNTPLHDGAMLIEGNRISHASCFLPLSEKKLSRAIGSRHRASIGLSEESDAIIVVVSEETGKISIAYKGELKSDFDDITLINELNALLR